jgi:hypothetical protein
MQNTIYVLKRHKKAWKVTLALFLRESKPLQQSKATPTLLHGRFALTFLLQLFDFLRNRIV